MRAVVFTRVGGPETLEPREIASPEPGPGEVRVAVEAAGFNFRDAMLREGQYPAPIAPGQPLGIEVVGTIESVGEGADASRIGQRVAALLPVDGGYAEFAVAPAGNAWPIGPDVSAATALGGLVQGLTAEFLIRRASPPAGGWALVHAAAGGVGPWLVHLLKARGFRVVGTASSDEKRAAVLGAGADLAIAPTPEAIGALDTPVDAIYHTIGGLLDAGLAKLAPSGSLVVYGAADGIMPALSAEAAGGLWFANQSFHGFVLYEPLKLEADRGAGVFAQILARGFNPPAAEYPLERASDAHRDVASRRTQGKVVLTVA